MKNPLAAPDWLTLTCTETRIETSWGWLPVKVDIVSFCVSLSAVISCVIGAAPSQARQSISQHHPDTGSQGWLVRGGNKKEEQRMDLNTRIRGLFNERLILSCETIFPVLAPCARVRRAARCAELRRGLVVGHQAHRAVAAWAGGWGPLLCDWWPVAGGTRGQEHHGDQWSQPRAGGRCDKLVWINIH